MRSLGNYIKRKKNKIKNSTGNDYEWIRKLGKGGMATVDLVQNKSNGEYYAMKVINMFHYDEKKKKNVHNEITLLSVLDSPFILKYHEHFLKNQNMYIVMEFAEGGVVSDRIKQYK